MELSAPAAPQPRRGPGRLRLKAPSWATLAVGLAAAALLALAGGYALGRALSDADEPARRAAAVGGPGREAETRAAGGDWHAAPVASVELRGLSRVVPLPPLAPRPARPVRRAPEPPAPEPPAPEPPAPPSPPVIAVAVPSAAPPGPARTAAVERPRRRRAVRQRPVVIVGEG
jgi:hypothetical protein